MAVGLSTRNLFVLTLIGSFAYTVYPLPFSSSVEQRRPGISNSSSGNNNVPLLSEDSLPSSLTSLDRKHPFWQPGCNQHQQRHRRSLKQVRQVLNIVVKKLNQTFHNHISKLYKEPMTKLPRYSWLPGNPGKKLKDATLEVKYPVLYKKLQEYAVILHILNRTGPPAGYEPNQFRHAERQNIINSIASLIRQMLCELEYTMKGKIDSEINLEKFENVIPSNLNHTQLYVYDMATFNAYKKFLMSWKRLLQKGKKNGRNKNRGQVGDDNKRKNKRKNQKKNPMNQKKKKGQRDGKLVVSQKHKKVPGKQQIKQPT